MKHIAAITLSLLLLPLIILAQSSEPKSDNAEVKKSSEVSVEARLEKLETQNKTLELLLARIIKQNETLIKQNAELKLQVTSLAAVGNAQINTLNKAVDTIDTIAKTQNSSTAANQKVGSQTSELSLPNGLLNLGYLKIKMLDRIDEIKIVLANGKLSKEEVKKLEDEKQRLEEELSSYNSGSNKLINEKATSDDSKSIGENANLLKPAEDKK